jgi:tetratricopeptide (TPR) repeat protein
MSKISSIATPEYRLTELRTLLNQPNLALTEVVTLWVAQLELAESRNERAIIVMLLKMLERSNFALPLELQIYQLYGRAVLLDLEGEMTKSAHLYQQGLELLTLPSGGNLAVEPDFLQAKLIIQKALAILSLDKIEEAENLLLKGLETVKRRNQTTAEGLALLGLGSIAMRKGDLVFAYDNFQTALAIFRATKNNLRIADTLNALGQVYNFQNRYQQSIPILEECISLRNAMSNSRDLGRTYASLGSAYYRLGQYSKCIDTLTLAYTLFKQNNNRNSVIVVNTNIAIAYFEINQADRASRHATEALEIARPLEDNLLLGLTLSVLAKCLALQGETEQALPIFQEAQTLTIALEKRDVNNSGTLYSHLGQALLLLAEQESEYQTALEYFQSALVRFVKLGDLDTQLRITTIPAKIILDNLGNLKNNSGSASINRILNLWWGVIQKLPENKGSELAPYLIKYAERLNRRNSFIQSYQVYLAGLNKLTPPISADSYLNRAELLLKVTQIAPSLEKKVWLEKALTMLKNGKAPSGRQKEVSKLLKSLE